MITKEQKARAIAKITHRVPFNEIAEELGIPLTLIKQWSKNLSLTDTTAIEANIHAVELISEGELLPVQEEKVKTTLEKAAIDVAIAISMPCATGDAIHAKALQLCASAISQLYSTIVLKNDLNLAENNPEHSTAFRRLMVD